MRSAAGYLVEILEGTYDPHAPLGKEGGYNPMDPEIEGQFDSRFYD